MTDAGADAVVYLAVNGPAFQVALFAAAYAGVPLVPVNYRLGREQIDHLLANHPRAYGIVEEEGAGVVARTGLDARTPEEWLAAAAANADAGTPLDEPADTESPAVIIYTSGTTSAPKGVLLRHANLVSYVFGTVEFMGADAADTALMSVPPYHIAAVSNALTNLYAGRRVLVLEHFTPERWLELVRTEHVTNAMVVPTMLARIMQTEGLDRSVPTLRTLSYGGAKMPLPVIERALREWPEVDFVNAYGLTETSSTVTVLGPEEHRAALAADDDAARARLASAGRPVPGIELEIRDEAGTVLAPGRTVRSGSGASRSPASTRAQGPVVDERGFFFTRDHGRLDAGGLPVRRGPGGRHDHPRRGEHRPGRDRGRPAAAPRGRSTRSSSASRTTSGASGSRRSSSRRPGSTLDVEELRAECKATLRSSKTPERIVCWEELPRTVTGKLLRREVVASLTAEA